MIILEQSKDEEFIKEQFIKGRILDDTKDYGRTQFVNEIYKLQQENQQLKIQISAREEEYEKLENKVNKIIEVIDEELIYDKVTDITSAIGDIAEKIKFYLSDCELISEFRKLERGASDVED